MISLFGIGEIFHQYPIRPHVDYNKRNYHKNILDSQAILNDVVDNISHHPYYCSDAKMQKFTISKIWTYDESYTSVNERVKKDVRIVHFI